MSDPNATQTVYDAASTPPPCTADRYAVVEVFGHQRHVGRISEVEQFGTKMMQVDEPNSAPVVSFEPGQFTTYFLAGAAIFRMTPCTLDYVQHYHYRADRQVGRLTAPLEIDRDAFMRDEDICGVVVEGSGGDALEDDDENVSRGTGGDHEGP